MPMRLLLECRVFGFDLSRFVYYGKKAGTTVIQDLCGDTEASLTTELTDLMRRGIAVVLCGAMA